MEKIEKINQLKDELKKEVNNENPDEKKIQKLTQKIALLGIGLDINLFSQKPFTNV